MYAFPKLTTVYLNIGSSLVSVFTWTCWAVFKSVCLSAQVSPISHFEKDSQLLWMSAKNAQRIAYPCIKYRTLYVPSH